MKKFVFSLIILLSTLSATTHAQCNESVKKAVLELMGDAQYIKDFSVTLEKAPNEAKTGMVRFNVLLNNRSEEHTSELQSRPHLVCRLLLEKTKQTLHPSGLIAL